MLFVLSVFNLAMSLHHFISATCFSVNFLRFLKVRYLQLMTGFFFFLPRYLPFLVLYTDYEV